MVNLIISEKNITARKIAEILSDKSHKVEKAGKHPVYTWTKNGETYRCFGLRGHILSADFPKEYSNWQKVDLFELIDTEIVKNPKEKSLIDLIKKEAKKADRLILATDFDREGELIGYDAMTIALSVNPKLEVKRARFSALTAQEIKESFSNLHDPYISLAAAGETRQEVDLVWGAVLTRFLSNAAKRYGKNFLSVGRVQSPTLALIVKREEEIRNFVPEKYYQILIKVEKDGQVFNAYYENKRIKEKKEAEEIAKKLGKTVVVSKVEERELIQNPPSPFNTTEFLAAASKVGVSPGAAMSYAEDLYTRGYISYPRVDNTVYPESLNLKGIVKDLTKYAPVSEYASILLQKPSLRPTRGKKESTDHPPIHPTGQIPGELDTQKHKIFDLVVRRFLATLSDAAKMHERKVELKSGELRFDATGLEYTHRGFLEVYPYLSNQETKIPKLIEGEELKVISVDILEKQTKPKGRYTQAGLIREMENLGLGTKSTRHAIIQSLFERGYIHGNPIQPTELGMAVGKAIIENMKEIATHEMTAELEQVMNEIEAGKKKKDEAVKLSRMDLKKVLDSAMKKSDEFLKIIREGASKDKVIGACPGMTGNQECGGMLVIKKAKSGKRFLGCTKFSEGCRVAFPLPPTGTVLSAGKECDLCGTPMVKLIKKSKKPWIFCPNPECESSNLKKNKTETQGNQKEEVSDAGK